MTPRTLAEVEQRINEWWEESTYLADGVQPATKRLVARVWAWLEERDRVIADKYPAPPNFYLEELQAQLARALDAERAKALEGHTSRDRNSPGAEVYRPETNPQCA